MAKTTKPKAAAKPKGATKPKAAKPTKQKAGSSSDQQAWERGEAVTCAPDESEQ